jgi:uncharacterized protein YutE (UPF0331/DUF86 family)
MVDKELIYKHIENMEAALSNLRKHGKVTPRDLQRDMDLLWIVERGLESIIQNLLDISAHLLSSRFKNQWEDYSELIERMGIHGILPEDFASQIKGMAGFRNVLVHDYMEVDLSIVSDVINNRLEDFEGFIKYVVDYLERDKA